MLREVKAREESAEGNRRWFADDFFELIVWLDERSTVESFQLCYDRRRWQRALTWTKRMACGTILSTTVKVPL